LGVIWEVANMILGRSQTVGLESFRRPTENIMPMIVFEGIVNGRTEPQRACKILGSQVLLEVGRPSPLSAALLKGDPVRGADDYCTSSVFGWHNFE
jgi:hypothetical protein